MSGIIGPYYVATDPDARSFINTALITKAPQKRAIDILVKDLKGVYNGTNYWQYVLWCFPIVGENEHSHKYNLKNPAVNYLEYSTLVSYTHTVTGMTGGAKINNFVCVGNVVGFSPVGIFAYVRENTNNGNPIYKNQSGQTFGFSSRTVSNTITAWCINNVLTVTGVTDGKGFLQYSQIGQGANTLNFYINGILRGSGTGEYGTIGTTQNSWGLALNGQANGSGVNGLTSNPNEISFGMAMRGIVLTDADNLALYEIVQKFQTSLGRQV